MGFVMCGLEAARFEPLFRRSDEELRAANIVRLTAAPGYPCRVSLRDATPGTTVLLLPFFHQTAFSPYRASGPIFVQEGAKTARLENAVPPEWRSRLYSARAYDREGVMVDADVAEGSELEALIERLLGRPDADCLHLHHARRGCFACRVERA